MLDQANLFLQASGKLQTLCYKEDIESAVRTPGMGGFQLLDLHDFPGHGTALVGVLDPFWDSKGYITPADKLAGREREIFTARDRKLEAARELRKARRQSSAIAQRQSDFGAEHSEGTLDAGEHRGLMRAMPNNVTIDGMYNSLIQTRTNSISGLTGTIPIQHCLDGMPISKETKNENKDAHGF
jgi:hypothetical protein